MKKSMRIKRKAMAVCLASAVFSTLFAGTAPWEAEAGESKGISVNYHTQAEILEYLQENQVDRSAETSYSTEASLVSPYDAGSISSDSQQSALNTLNAIRYIAGIDEVSINSDYTDAAQAAALVNAANKELSHSPEQPSGMSDSLYQLGADGASSCNLAYASWERGLGSFLVDAWMDDSDSSNIARVGHRRWILNPTMSETGFGWVYDSEIGTYASMYAFDRNASAEYYGVAWPAQNMPIEYFDSDYAWSISMGSSVDSSAVTVTLTRESDQESWSFSESSADGYFNVENSNYGQKGCIIFRPDDISYQAGDQFSVSITGLEEDVSYTVNFFETDVSDADPTATAEQTQAPASADLEDANDLWDGTSDTDWYEEEETEYEISTPEQLAGLAQLVNNGNTFEGKKITLIKDIFLNDDSYSYTWTPIAQNTNTDSGSGNVFQGVFDGNGHTVFRMLTGKDFDGGLFGYIGENGVVKAVTISQGYLYSAGCIANLNDGIISFCSNDSNCGTYELDAYSVFAIGGICNYNNNRIYGCKNYGTVWGYITAGIVGVNKQPTAVVSQCSNEGTVVGIERGAGIATYNYGYIYNCYNTGALADTYDGDDDWGGYAYSLCGIACSNYKFIANCYFTGSLSYVKDPCKGAFSIVDEDYYKGATNCYAVSSEADDNRAVSLSYEEMQTSEFLTMLDDQEITVLSAWKADDSNANQGLPITVADYNSAIGNYKIQPELWMATEDITLDIQDDSCLLDFSCYYNEAEPVLTIADADIAELVYDEELQQYYIKPLKTGTTQVVFYFAETENNISAEYMRGITVTANEAESEESDPDTGQTSPPDADAVVTQSPSADLDAAATQSPSTDLDAAAQAAQSPQPTSDSAGSSSKEEDSCEHSYGTPVLVKKATRTQNGKKVSICTKCGKKKTTVIYKASVISLSRKIFIYNGKKQKPKVIVKNSKGKKISQKFYKVTYKGASRKSGTYQVVVKFKGNYKGKKKLKYKILP
ncbi:MAG: CAP domain-containing protein [Clostridiaceae bacterium]|nr:CAP domain-containing protein [Clostridiaceae bacterium]